MKGEGEVGDEGGAWRRCVEEKRREAWKRRWGKGLFDVCQGKWQIPLRKNANKSVAFVH